MNNTTSNFDLLCAEDIKNIYFRNNSRITVNNIKKSYLSKGAPYKDKIKAFRIGNRWVCNKTDFERYINNEHSAQAQYECNAFYIAC